MSSVRLKEARADVHPSKLAVSWPTFTPHHRVVEAVEVLAYLLIHTTQIDLFLSNITIDLTDTLSKLLMEDLKQQLRYPL
jgi:hypothetical protein